MESRGKIALDRVSNETIRRLADKLKSGKTSDLSAEDAELNAAIIAAMHHLGRVLASEDATDEDITRAFEECGIGFPLAE